MDQKKTEVLKELDEDDEQEIKDFLNRLGESTQYIYIIEECDEFRRITNEYNITYEDEYEIVMKAIERAEDRVKKVLDEVNEILTTWYKKKVLNRDVRYDPQVDVEKSLSDLFKEECNRFVYAIDDVFEDKLKLCNGEYVAIVRIVNYEKLFDDFINKDVEHLCQNFVLNLKSITGVDEIEN